MVSTDPIADMLARIRNAIAVNKREIEMPHSKIKEAVARKLVDSSYLSAVDVEDGNGPQKVLKIIINSMDQNARITEISRLSKPGRRYYVGADKIPQFRRGRGVVIVSTSKGLMTDAEARDAHLGGELICQVY